MTDEQLIEEAALEALEELANVATPGPWEAGDVWVYTMPVYPDDSRLSDVLGMKFADEDRADAEHARGLANAAFIAAADPTVVLALIAELRRARADLAVFEATHTPTDDERAIFEAIADRLGEHSQAQNYEIADSGEYETKLRGPIDVEVLAERLVPTVAGFRRSSVQEPSATDEEYDARLGDGDRDDPEPQGEPSEEETKALEAVRRWTRSSGPGVRVLRVLLSMAERAVQGEPSDAYVRAVWDALGPGITVHLDFDSLRAALRAAAEVRGER